MNEKLINKHQRKLKGQSRMDNPEKLATLCTQGTGQRQTKQKTQYRKKKMSNRDPTKNVVNPGGRAG